MNKLLIALASIIGLFSLFVIGGSFYTVDEGERAVIVSQGKISMVAGPGFHWKKPFFDDAHYISVRANAIEFPEEGVYTADRQPAKVTFSVNYAAVSGDKEITELYREYQTLDGLEGRVMRRQVKEAVKNVFGTFTADTAIRERGRLNAEITAAIASVGGTLVKMEGVNIENIDFSDALEAAAEERAKAEMTVQRKKQELEQAKVDNQIKLANAQTAADSKLAQATADAKATRLKGEAEAAAIKAKSDALAASPALVELTKAEKWDGKLPQQFVPGSTVPFLAIK